MKIYFLGVPASNKNLNSIFNRYYKGNPQVRPQQNFDFSLVQGLSKYCTVEALSVPAVESYPRSSCLIYKGKKESINSNLSIKYISMLNLSLIKSLFLFISVVIWSFKIITDRTEKKEKVIMIANVSFATTYPLLIISRVFNIKFVSVMSDLPHYTVGYTKNFKLMIQKYTNGLTKYICSKFDGYILLSRHMSDIVNKNNKPYLVVEGIFYELGDDETKKADNLLKRYKGIKYVMYAGTLHKKFGVERLVQNFLRIKNLPDNLELWIFGQGDFQDQLKKIAKENDNIRFFETMSRNNIYKIEKNSLLLVNPRPSDEEYTKYSFPSKTIEYMSSGRPVLTTRLAGIPSEYDEYLYYIDDSTDEKFIESLKQIIEKDSDELTKRGSRNKQFIHIYKNKYYQAKKIVDFIEKEIFIN